MGNQNVTLFSKAKPDKLSACLNDPIIQHVDDIPIESNTIIINNSSKTTYDLKQHNLFPTNTVKDIQINFNHSLTSLDNLSIFVNVETIQCNFNQITQLVLSTLLSLRRLVLSSNLLKSIKLLSFSRFPQLEYLDLQENELEYISPELLTSPILHTVKLDYNRLDTLLPLSISIKHLTITHNNLVSISNIRLLINLTYLDVSFNRIESIPKEIFYMISLETFKCHHNNLTTLPDSFVLLPNLEWLNLSHNRLSSLPNWVNHSFNKLTYLNLSHNRITMLPESFFSSICNIKTLYMMDNRLCQIPSSIDQLNNPQFINFSINKISRIPPSISKLDSLVSLFLFGNNITNIPECIYHMNGLCQIDISYNPISKDELSHSIQDIPCVHIDINNIPDDLDNYQGWIRHKDFSQQINDPFNRSPSSRKLMAPKIVTEIPMSIIPNIGYHSTINKMNHMEDRLVVTRGLFNMDIMCIFDGHGGDDISNYLCNNVIRILTKNIGEMIHHESIHSILDVTYNELSQMVYKYALDRILEFMVYKKPLEVNPETNEISIPHFDASTYATGSTSMIVLMDEQKLYCSHLGNSKLVICRNMTSIPITKDHKPYDYDERKYIYERSGYVLDGRVNGMLSTSRAFAHFHLPISSIPDYYEVPIDSDLKFVIVASDGLWDFVPDQLAVDIVLRYIDSDIGYDSKRISFILAEYAIKMGSKDNISVIVIFP